MPQQISPNQYPQNKWLLDESTYWFSNIAKRSLPKPMDYIDLYKPTAFPPLFAFSTASPRFHASLEAPARPRWCLGWRRRGRSSLGLRHPSSGAKAMETIQCKHTVYVYMYTVQCNTCNICISEPNQSLV